MSRECFQYIVQKNAYFWFYFNKTKIGKTQLNKYYITIIKWYQVI
jgi:hypothetical protein